MLKELSVSCSHAKGSIFADYRTLTFKITTEEEKKKRLRQDCGRKGLRAGTSKGRGKKGQKRMKDNRFRDSLFPERGGFSKKKVTGQRKGEKIVSEVEPDGSTRNPRKVHSLRR